MVSDDEYMGNIWVIYGNYTVNIWVIYGVLHSHGGTPKRWMVYKEHPDIKMDDDWG